MQYYSSSAPYNNIYMIQGLDKVQPINSKYILTIHNYFDFQGFPFGLETRATSGTPSIHCSLPYLVTINWRSLFLANRFFGSSNCKLHQVTSLTCLVLQSLDVFDLHYDPTQNKIIMIFNKFFSKAQFIEQRLGPIDPSQSSHGEASLGV